MFTFVPCFWIFFFFFCSRDVPSIHSLDVSRLNGFQVILSLSISKKDSGHVY